MLKAWCFKYLKSEIYPAKSKKKRESKKKFMSLPGKGTRSRTKPRSPNARGSSGAGCLNGEKGETVVSYTWLTVIHVLEERLDHGISGREDG